jgi:hypothetical protein
VVARPALASGHQSHTSSNQIERPLGNLKLCAVMIDGIAFDGETFVVALGIGQDGRKTVLGLPTGRH